MRDWYMDWEREKEEREEELALLRGPAKVAKPEPKTEKGGQYCLPLEIIDERHDQ